MRKIGISFRNVQANSVDGRRLLRTGGIDIVHGWKTAQVANDAVGRVGFSKLTLERLHLGYLRLRELLCNLRRRGTDDEGP